MNSKDVFLIVLAVVFLVSCGGDPVIPDAKTRDVKPATTLPSFTRAPNEVQIAGSMNSVDPSWVLGSIVNRGTGEVRGLDSLLSRTAKPVITPQAEVFFDDVIDNSLAGNVGWLDFLKSEVSASVKAEVSIVKTAKVTITNQDLDDAKLDGILSKIPSGDRDNYGVIVGYVDYVLSASLLRESGAATSASGYGAVIGGKWYGKASNTSVEHRLVAIWAPLPFVASTTSASESRNLDKEVTKAIARGKLKVAPLSMIRFSH